MEALTTLVKCNMTAEVFRSLALFITYAYHQPTNVGSRTPKSAHGTLPARSGSKGTRRPTVATFFDGKEVPSTIMTKRQTGTKVLEMYTELLCEKGNTTNIRKFARTVTNKVNASTHLHIITQADFCSGYCTFWQKMTLKSLCMVLKSWCDWLSSTAQAMLPSSVPRLEASPSCDIDSSDGGTFPHCGRFALASYSIVMWQTSTLRDLSSCSAFWRHLVAAKLPILVFYRWSRPCCSMAWKMCFETKMTQTRR